MKNIILSFTAAALSLMAAGSSQARDHGNRACDSLYYGYTGNVGITSYNGSHQACPTPVYTERYLIGYDRYGRAIWGTRAIRHYTPVVTRYVAPCPPQPYRTTYYRPQPSYCSPGIVLRASFCR